MDQRTNQPPPHVGGYKIEVEVPRCASLEEWQRDPRHNPKPYWYYERILWEVAFAAGRDSAQNHPLPEGEGTAARAEGETIRRLVAAIRGVLDCKIHGPNLQLHSCPCCKNLIAAKESAGDFC